MMVHTRITHIIGGYNHWLVRIDYNSFEITHISHGIVFGTAMFHSEGPEIKPEAFDGRILVVGTMTITAEGSEDHLHIFGGEGDNYCIYHTIPLNSVMWLPIENVTTVHHRQSSSLSLWGLGKTAMVLYYLMWIDLVMVGWLHCIRHYYSVCLVLSGVWPHAMSCWVEYA